MAPVVSVIMPARNAATYLREAVGSILAQSFPDLELIVVDDASTDETPSMLRDLARSDPRLRHLREESAGVIAAANLGAREAGGRYLARMDADDVAFPDRIAKQVAYLDAHPRVAVVGGAMQYLGPGGPLPSFLRHPTEPEAVRVALESNCCLAHPTVMILRDVFISLGGYRPAAVHAEDYDLWLRVSERHDLANLPDTLLYYRLHTGQVSFAQLSQQVMSFLSAKEAARRRARGAPDPLDGRPAVSRGDLVGLGVPEETIDARLAEAYVDLGYRLVRFGLHDQAEILAMELERLPLAPKARRRIPSELQWLRAKIDLGRGKRVRGLAKAAQAISLRPAFAGNAIRALWRVARRGKSGADADGE